jgi:hypothetical protein
VKRIFSVGTFVTGILFQFLFAGTAYAQDICAVAGSNFSALCKLRLDSGAGGIVGTIVQVLIIIGILVALFFLIFGGIKYASSGGDRAKTEASRQMIINALIGLVISLVAYGILNLVMYFITGQSATSFKIPRLID